MALLYQRRQLIRNKSMVVFEALRDRLDKLLIVGSIQLSNVFIHLFIHPFIHSLFHSLIHLLFYLLHLHEIVEGYLFTAVCLCVCLCVCVCPVLLVNKIPDKWMHWFGRCFRQMAVYRTGSNPIEIGDLGSKIKVTVKLHPFFLLIAC